MWIMALIVCQGFCGDTIIIIITAIILFFFNDLSGQPII